jgi:hypothetical protein
MKNFLIILYFFFFQNSFGQIETIKIAKDTVFNIEDFVNFKGSDTTQKLSFIKNKYFRFSGLLKSIVKKSICGDIDNTPFTLISKSFNLDFCIWSTGKIYSAEITINDPHFLSKSNLTGQLKDLSFIKESSKKKNGIVITNYSWQGKYSEKYVVVHSRRKKILSISIY